jgi:DNA-binding CsgD family transcriptional regulator
MTQDLLGILTRLRLETGVPVAFGGSVGAGSDRFTISRAIGQVSGTLEGLAVSTGHGVGGRVLREMRGVAAVDYIRDRQITHVYDHAVAAEGLRSVAGVPVIVDRQVRAVLYLANREPTHLGTSALRALQRAAHTLTIELASQSADSLGASSLAHETLAGVGRGDRETLRMVYAELTELAQTIDDEATRARIARIRDGLEKASVAAVGCELSRREIDVLALAAVAYSNAEIGQRLGLKRETVKSYLRSAMRKLNAHNRIAAVQAARAMGSLP